MVSVPKPWHTQVRGTHSLRWGPDTVLKQAALPDTSSHKILSYRIKPVKKETST